MAVSPRRRQGDTTLLRAATGDTWRAAAFMCHVAVLVAGWTGLPLDVVLEMDKCVVLSLYAAHAEGMPPFSDP